eukprot:761215_1
MDLFVKYKSSLLLLRSLFLDVFVVGFDLLNGCCDDIEYGLLEMLPILFLRLLLVLDLDLLLLKFKNNKYKHETEIKNNIILIVLYTK